MKRIVLLYLLAVSGMVHAASWSDLWLTHDQQAQRLLDAGKPAQAARSFTDSRRRAYAQIKAGQYADAAQQLENFSDPQSQYNRGNALARSGKLEDALRAYDQAIKQTRTDTALGRDARHNRKLVAEQLKRQQQQPAPGESSQPPQQDQQPATNEPSQNDRERQAQGQNTQQNSAGAPKQQQQGQHGEQEQQSQAANRKPPASPQQQAAPTGSAGSQAEQERQQAANARRDAEAALAQRDDNAKSQPPQRTPLQDQRGSKDTERNTPAAVGDQPPSEQALALEQWLRQIPDDPAGLLRRKFLIEHMKRQQESR